MTDKSKIREAVRNNSATYLQSLKDACSIPSVSTEGKGFDEMTAWLEERLTRLGAQVSRLTVPDGADALLGVIPGTGNGELMIYDHYDVQPVDPIDLWESPPFELTERDGRLYARGAADNKGDLVARLSAIELYREIVGELPFTIKFFIEGEEESGSPNFERICAQYREQLRADHCVWEGGWFDLEGRPQMYFGCKGLLYIELKTTKLSGDQHSSVAVYAPSAAWQLIKAIASMKDEDDNIIVQGFHDNVVAPGDLEMRALESWPVNEDSMMQSLGIREFNKQLSGIDLKKHTLFTPTANIAGLWSGYTVPGATKTVLPAEASAKMDFRLVPDQDADDIYKKVRAHLESHGFDDVEVEVLSAQNPSRSPLDSKLGKAAESAARSWFDKELGILPLMWATGPMHPITQVLGIPVCSPPGVGRPDSNLHAPNEHCRIEDFLDIVGYTVAYLEEYGRTEG